jgi:hypothetical protein
MKCISLLIILLTVASCKEECPPEIRAWGDQYLEDDFSSEITSVNYPERIMFRDSSGSTFEFIRYTMGRRIEKDVYLSMLECENGSTFLPYINREVYELGYTSLDLQDSIELSIVSSPLIVFDSFEELSPEDNSRASIDRFFVKLSFSGCPIVKTFRDIHTFNQESRIRDSPFILGKFGQSYDDIYGIQSSWSNEVWFSYSRGIVSFNYCGKNYAQVVN